MKFLIYASNDLIRSRPKRCNTLASSPVIQSDKMPREHLAQITQLTELRILLKILFLRARMEDPNIKEVTERVSRSSFLVENEERQNILMIG